MIERIEGNAAWCRCKNCGRSFRVSLPEPGDYRAVVEGIVAGLWCDSCADAVRVENDRRRQEMYRRDIKSQLAEIGLPPKFAELSEPYVRQTAEWLWRHRRENLLIAGETGTGKTSSAAVVARKLTELEGKSIRYKLFRELISEWNGAKTSDSDSDRKFLERLGRIDLLIVDEVVGKRGERLSGSSQELLFELLDGVYRGQRKTLIWLLGNFYDGALDDMFFDPLPAKRRIEESFTSIWIDKTTKEIKTL